MTRYDIQLPRVSDGRRLNVVDATVNINIMPLSTATVTLPDDETLAMRSWVEMFTSQGSAGVFRVRAPGRSYGTGNNVYQLDHGIVEVGDYIIKESTEETKYKGAANTVIRNIWAHYGGSKWKLGTVAPTEKVEYSGDYGNVLSALLDVMGQLPGHMMTFDFSTSPRWTLNIVARPGTVAGEGRLDRNIKSVRISYDDSNMCTKLLCYTTQAEGSATRPSFVLNADTQSTYGVVEQSAGQDENETEADFRAKCNKFLAQHKNPLVSVNIDGIDLQAVTGEAVDGYSIGSKYRLAMPDYGLTLEETLVTLNWPSVYGDPGNVNVTLGNEELSISGAYGGTLSGGGSASSLSQSSKSKSAAKTAHDDHIKRVEMAGILHEAGLEWDENHVLIFANNEATGLGRMHAAINVQADEIKAEVSRAKTAEGQLTENYSAVKQTADSISAEVVAARDGQTTLSAKIKLEADRITSEVTDRTNAEAELSSRITQTADAITTKVSKTDYNGEELVSMINQTAEKITIQAQKIELSGYVTASQLAAAFSEATLVSTQRLSVSSSFYINGAYASWQSTNVVLSAWANKSSQRAFALTDGSKITGTYYMEPVTSIGTDTQPIFYLGRVDSD